MICSHFSDFKLIFSICGSKIQVLRCFAIGKDCKNDITISNLIPEMLINFYYYNYYINSDILRKNPIVFLFLVRKWEIANFNVSITDFLIKSGFDLAGLGHLSKSTDNRTLRIRRSTGCPFSLSPRQSIYVFQICRNPNKP